MSTAPEFLETDVCINCHEEIGATGIHILYADYMYADYMYANGRSRSIPINIYAWVHINTGVGKCVDRPGMYAAGNKKPSNV
jgi:hypothetical protein